MSPREIRSYRTQAIILGHIEYGEADRILKVFTFQKGKITAIAKASGAYAPARPVTWSLSRGSRSFWQRAATWIS